MIKLGDSAKDMVTGLTGIVVGKASLLNGCDRIAIQAREAKDGKPAEATWFDKDQVKVMKLGVLKLVDRSKFHKIRLGDEVMDKISGFHGIVDQIVEYAWGCRRIGVQPQKLDSKTGVPAKDCTFDEPLLEIKDPQKLKIEKVAPETTRNPGGPAHLGSAKRQ